MSLIYPIVIVFLIMNGCSAPSLHAHNPKHPAASSILILDPAGDAEHPGRHLESHFERGLTLQCVEYIHHALTQQFPHKRIMITRKAGDKVIPLQHAHLANRLDNVQLYLHCAFYKEHGPRAVVRIYRFSYQKQPLQYSHDIMFFPYHHAYMHSEHQSLAYAHKFYTLFTNYALEYNFFDIYPPCAFPHAGLCGITCPAVVIEIGLPHDNNWQQCADIMTQALATFCVDNR